MGKSKRNSGQNNSRRDPLLEVARSSQHDVVYVLKGNSGIFKFFYVQVYKRSHSHKTFRIGPVCLPRQLQCDPLGQLGRLKLDAFNVPVFDRMRLLFLQRCTFWLNNEIPFVTTHINPPRKSRKRLVVTELESLELPANHLNDFDNLEEAVRRLLEGNLCFLDTKRILLFKKKV